MFRNLTLGDKVLLTILVSGTLASYFLVGKVAGPGATVLVQVDGHIQHKAELKKNAVFSVHGEVGELVVEIRDGTVAVIQADCPNRICVRTGRRGRTGDVIVCVPNKTIIRIEGEEETGVRAVTG
jgi:hypothetical protein